MKNGDLILCCDYYSYTDSTYSCLFLTNDVLFNFHKYRIQQYKQDLNSIDTFFTITSDFFATLHIVKTIVES